MSHYNVVGKHKTIITQENETTRIRYHNTVIVQFSDKCICLNSGRWRTATTKLRMNQAAREFHLGFTVCQRNFKWFITCSEGTREFHDGMVLHLFDNDKACFSC